MKYAISVLIVLACISMAAPAGAGIIGSRASSTDELQFNLSGGVAYEERDMRDKDRARSNYGYAARRFLIKPHLHIIPHFGIYGLVGMADLQAKNDSPNNFEGSLGTNIGGGLKVHIMEPKNEAGNINIDLGANMFNSSDGDVTAEFFEYHAALYFTYEMRRFTAFTGLKWSRCDLTYNASGNAPDLDLIEEDEIGFLSGLDYFLTPQVFFSFEMQNFDKSLVYGGIGFKFRQ